MSSLGPDSAIGQRAARNNPARPRGLNENLAREILELHTLGVRSGYGQQDVVALARHFVADTPPPALRGAAEVNAYAPSALRLASDDLLQRVQQLYATDAQLHAMWTAALQARGMAGPALRQSPADLGDLAARFLVQPAGPRIAMLETGGWDTHSAQAPRLANQLKALDALLAALHVGLGAHWAETFGLDSERVARALFPPQPALPALPRLLRS
ncbi:MAG: DUF1800 family protein [Rubrivivax sp.]|nr:DUF1800 family protein [Rubrivivax sp.]